MVFSEQIIILDKAQKYTMTDEGFLITKAILTRSGVFDYGSHKQFRSPDEVFKPESLDTLKLKPITFHHPSEMVKPENINKYVVGVIGQDVQQENNFVSATISITSKPAIDYIMEMHEKGNPIELSCGYWLDLDEEKGSYQGEEYQFIQKNIKYNHVSIVEKGRAGENVRILLDHITTEDMKGEIMTIEKEQFDAVTIELDAARKEIDAIKEQLDEAKREVERTKEELLNVKNELSSASEELKKAEIKDSAKEFEIETEGKTAKEIKVLCIKKLSADFVADNKSEDYINARFDAAIEYNKILKENQNNLDILSIKANAKKETEIPGEKKKTKQEEMIEKIKMQKYDE